jgi:hypothetical protein
MPAIKRDSGGRRYCEVSDTIVKLKAGRVKDVRKAGKKKPVKKHLHDTPPEDERQIARELNWQIKSGPEHKSNESNKIGNRG